VARVSVFSTPPLDEKPVDDLGRIGELVLETHVATQDHAVLRFAGFAYLGKAVARAGLNPELGAFGVDDLVPQTGPERRLKLECAEPVVLITPRAEPVRTVREGVVGLTANLPPLRCGYRAVAAVVTGQAEGVCPFVARILDLERGVCRLVLAVAAGKRSTELALPFQSACALPDTPQSAMRQTPIHFCITKLLYPLDSGLFLGDGV
jgi:hypothetical protein